MIITINEAVRAKLETYSVGTGLRGLGRWSIGAQLALSENAILEPFIHLSEPDLLPFRFGAFSYSYSPLNIVTSVGRYTSIATAVTIMGTEHPTDRVSTSPALYGPGTTSLLRFMKAAKLPLPDMAKFQPRPAEVRIGHDVWIGSDVILARGITIGDGAVIGAGSVVTKDVPPYAVVAGVPAKLIRMRFPEAVVERLRALEWWRYGPDVLMTFDMSDPERFADTFPAEIEARQIEPRRFKLLRGSDLIALSDEQV